MVVDFVVDRMYDLRIECPVKMSTGIDKRRKRDSRCSPGMLSEGIITTRGVNRYNTELVTGSPR